MERSCKSVLLAYACGRAISKYLQNALSAQALAVIERVAGSGCSLLLLAELQDLNAPDHDSLQLN